MGAFEVVVEMGGSQEGLIAAVLGTFEQPFVVMRAQMFLQSCWSVECLCTALERAAVGFQLGRIFGGLGGRRGKGCCGSLMQSVAPDTRGV